MNPDTQGRTNKINFKKNIKPPTPHSTNNILYKKLNNNTIIATILQLTHYIRGLMMTC